MKPKFNINDYKKLRSDVCMYCKTKQESDNFREYLDSIGLTWNNGRKYTSYDPSNLYNSKDSVWNCYYFNIGCVGVLYRAKLDNVNILNYSDFDWKNPCKFMGVKNETKI